MLLGVRISTYKLWGCHHKQKQRDVGGKAQFCDSSDGGVDYGGWKSSEGGEGRGTD